MKQQTIDRIIEEHKAWTQHNFDYEAPEFGLVEEVGEFAHQLLKEGQGIRVTSPELRKDALADATIFFFHLCWKYNHQPYDHPTPLIRSRAWHLGTLATVAGKIVCCIADRGHVDTILLLTAWEQIGSIARIEGWVLEDIVCDVWEQVRKRDFRLYPDTGLPPELP
jgi:hypothetical protein